MEVWKLLEKGRAELSRWDMMGTTWKAEVLLHVHSVWCWRRMVCLTPGGDQDAPLDVEVCRNTCVNGRRPADTQKADLRAGQELSLGKQRSVDSSWLKPGGDQTLAVKVRA